MFLNILMNIITNHLQRRIKNTGIYFEMIFGCIQHAEDVQLMYRFMSIHQPYMICQKF